MPAQFDTNFSDLNHFEFIGNVGNFADHLLVHSFFKDNLPGFLKHPAEVKEDLNGYNDSVNLVEAEGGHKNLKDRDDRRNDIQVWTVFMGQYVVMRSVTENDPSFLTTVGLKLKTRAVAKAAIADLVAPFTVTVKHGKVSGVVIVTWSKVAGAGTTEVEMCEGEPNEESFTAVGHFAKCHTEVKGLQPGKKVNFRVRCHGTGDPGPYSQTVSIIVL